MARLTFFRFLSDQWTKLPPAVMVDLSGKTVMVIGANTGIGLETSKHLARMSPGRLILGCRNPTKGESAIKEIEKETGYQSTELWIIDLGVFSSVKSFADKFEKDGGRLDIVVENAAVALPEYEETPDGWESTLQVNYLSLSLLALLLLPRMAQTAKDHNTRPRLVVVTSEVHMLSELEKAILSRPNTLKTFGSKEYCTPSVMGVRYQDTKLLNVFFARALDARIQSSANSVTVDSVNPGFCRSDLARNISGFRLVLHWLMANTIARTSEEGSRSIVYAAMGGPEREDDLRGAYINRTSVAEAGDNVISEKGKVIQDKIWGEMLELLEQVDPRVKTTVNDFLTEAQ